MNPTEALRRALWAVLWLSAPAVLGTLVAAVLVDFGQGLLRLRDGGAPRIARLIVGLVCALALGAWMSGHVVRFGAAMINAASRW